MSDHERDPTDDAPGFLMSAVYVFLGFVLIGAVTAALSALTGNEEVVGSVMTIVVIVGVVVWVVRDNRVAKIVGKGLVVWLAISVVLVGACVALLMGMYN